MKEMKARFRRFKKAIVSNPPLIVFGVCGLLVVTLSNFSRSNTANIIKFIDQDLEARLFKTTERLAKMTASEELDSYRVPEDAQRADWKALRQKLIEFAEDANIKYAYYMRVIGDKVQYIVDNDLVEDTRVGIDKELVELSTLDLMPAIKKKKTWVTPLGEYAPDWDGLRSAYAPILNSDGVVAAVCGVDIEDKSLVKISKFERRVSIYNLLLIIVTLLGGMYIFRNMQRAVESRTGEVIKLRNAILRGLANIVDNNDHSTGMHIERTRQYLEVLIRELKAMNLHINQGAKKYQEDTKEFDIKLILESCQLHDLGKIAIPDSILKKPGPLTKEEFAEMKKHVEYGVGIIENMETEVSDTELLKYAKIFAETHHEKWDGSGYPKGLAGVDIPLLGRLMAIADVYDSLTSNRPYKEALPHAEALRIIREGKGSHFDPFLVDVFERVGDQFALISSQQMNQQRCTGADKI